MRFVLLLFALYVSPLLADTLIKSGCSNDYPGVEWFIYEDSDGNRYTTKDPRSWKCGFDRF